jgi:hypothetical protein
MSSSGLPSIAMRSAIDAPGPATSDAEMALHVFVSGLAIGGTAERSSGYVTNGIAVVTMAARPSLLTQIDYRPLRRPRLRWPNNARLAFWVIER